jgi:hypothetical protein
VAFSWLIYLNCVMMHGLANFKVRQNVSTKRSELSLNMNVGFTSKGARITHSYSDRALLHCNRGMQLIKDKCMLFKMQSVTVEFLCFAQNILPPFEPPFTLRHCDNLFSAFNYTGFRGR